MKHDQRKSKRRVIRLYKKLATNSFAIGCRGHPGIVQNKRFTYLDVHGADLDVVSLLDGSAGSCSVFNCSPDPITGDFARWLSKPFNFEAWHVMSTLNWQLAFVDFDQHYSKEQFAETCQKTTEAAKKLMKLVTISPQYEIAEKLVALSQADDRSKLTTEDIGFHGQTYRHKGMPTCTDFATEVELAKVKEFGDENFSASLIYKNGVLMPFEEYRKQLR